MISNEINIVFPHFGSAFAPGVCIWGRVKTQKPNATPRLYRQLKRLGAETIARDSGWLQRSGSKITAEHFCLALLGSTQLKAASLRIVAMVSGLISAVVVSKQALHKRVNASSIAYLRSLLAAAASSRLPTVGKAPKLCGFNRIAVQDSTSLALPAAVRDAFPASGNSNASTAGMRVHATYDLVGQRFVGFDICDGCTPDQKRAVDGASGLGEGDLLIRDLGYFSVEAFAEILSDGLKAISRYKLSVNLYCPETGDRVDLPKLLRRKGNLDTQVLVSKKHRLKLRLVAFELPPEVAQQRRRAFRANAKRKGKTPSKASLQLQGWQIYLTNCPARELGAQEVRALYRQRWSIEILFKAFKTHMRFEQLPTRASATLLQALALASLIRITLLHAHILPRAERIAGARKVSILKLYGLSEALEALPAELAPSNTTITECILKHCLYEIRNRTSLPEKLATLG